MKLAGMGLSLKDSPGTFDPSEAAVAYGGSPVNESDEYEDDGEDLRETEQL
jgi:DNA-directed RNA polymerase subunit alpha